MSIEQWSERVLIVRRAADPHLGEELQAPIERVATQPADVILDFATVRYLNSSHISRLLRLRKTALSAGSRLVLCAVETQAWGAFLVTGLDKVFEFCESVPTALATLQVARE